VQVAPINSRLKAPETKLFKLKYDELLSKFAFRFNLCRYTKELEVQNTVQTQRRRQSVGRAADSLREAVVGRQRRLGAMLLGARGAALPDDLQIQGLTAGPYTRPLLSST